MGTYKGIAQYKSVVVTINGSSSSRMSDQYLETYHDGRDAYISRLRERLAPLKQRIEAGIFEPESDVFGEPLTQEYLAAAAERELKTLRAAIAANA